MKEFKKHVFLLFFLAVLSVSACNSKKTAASTVSDHDLTLQVMQLVQGQNDENNLTYKTRIVPDKVFLTNKSDLDKSNLVFHMDSCFYLQSGAIKIYPSLVQPVANGVGGSYEYLLQFDMRNTASATWDFIYQDKYLNKKKYILNLK